MDEKSRLVERERKPVNREQHRLRGYSPSELADPYPAWKRARTEQPVFWDARLGYWQVTRYDDVGCAQLNTTELSSEGFFALAEVHPENRYLLPRGFEYEAPSLANADPPTHTRIRRLADRPFKPRRVADLEPELRRIADELIDGFYAAGSCDLIEQFSMPFSLRTITHILGVPDDDLHELRRYSDERPASLEPGISVARQAEILSHYGTYYDFLERTIERARREPGDDLLSSLVAEADRGADAGLSDRELVSTLIGAGNETTRYLIGNMLLLLLQHPEQLEAVRADPQLAAAAVEETLRHSSSVKGNTRVATTDFTIGGVTIPPGDLVQLCWGSSGRDEAVFDRPDEFDIFRPDTRRHIAFSRGPHTCLGAPLARLEATIALQHLLERLPNLRLVREPRMSDEYVSTVQVYGVTRLELAWAAG